MVAMSVVLGIISTTYEPLPVHFHVTSMLYLRYNHNRLQESIKGCALPKYMYDDEAMDSLMTNHLECALPQSTPSVLIPYQHQIDGVHFHNLPP